MAKISLGAICKQSKRCKHSVIGTGKKCLFEFFFYQVFFFYSYSYSYSYSYYASVCRLNFSPL